MTNFKLRVFGTLPQGLSWSSGYNITSTDTLATVGSTFNTAFGALWTDAVNGLETMTPAGVATTETICYSCNATWRVTGKDIRPLANAGTNANHISNLAASPYLHFTGAIDNRSDGGHMKFPPFSNDKVVDGLVINAAVTALGTSLQTFFTTMKALAGYQAVSFNKLTNRLGDPPFTNHVLTDFTMVNRCGTERGRQNKLKTTFTAVGTL